MTGNLYCSRATPPPRTPPIKLRTPVIALVQASMHSFFLLATGGLHHHRGDAVRVSVRHEPTVNSSSQFPISRDRTTIRTVTTCWEQWTFQSSANVSPDLTRHRTPSLRPKNGLQGTLGAPRPIFKFKGNRAATGLSGSRRDELGFQKSGKFCSGSVR